MASRIGSLKFKRAVNAPPAEVYRAFTNSTALREWFCDAAQADACKSGRLYAWWNNGYYASGEFTALAPCQRIAFTWHGRGELAATRVQIALAEKNGGTLLTLTHAGIGAGKAWAKSAKQIVHGWEIALENLQWVLETGQDLRLVRRPMLGINIGEFNPDIAAKLGVPVVEGLRLEGVVPGKGAQAAGLQKNDVLVNLGRKKVTSFSGLVSVLQKRRAGDKVKVVFYRGSEKKTVTMELSPRPLPEVPVTSAALAEAVQKKFAEGDAELARCFANVSEAQADRSPAPGEWSAKETVAHLIAGERENHCSIADLINNAERWSDDLANPTNVPARVRATVQAFPTVPALLEELKRNEAETVAMLAALPPEFVAHKGTFWRLGHYLLQIADHTDEHMKQIRTAIASAG
jgi:uncharacterized protein YndB with AHSA1/START domain